MNRRIAFWSLTVVVTVALGGRQPSEPPRIMCGPWVTIERKGPLPKRPSAP